MNLYELLEKIENKNLHIVIENIDCCDYYEGTIQGFYRLTLDEREYLTLTNVIIDEINPVIECSSDYVCYVLLNIYVKNRY